uniref:Uncharacterized protein n=1 Tax=Panagrolaimus davidi TaxID=227884 RepID=A0A914R661_9BILA
MLISTSKSLFSSLIISTRNTSNLFIGKNVRLRNYHNKFPLAGIKVTVLKEPFNSQLIPKLFENFGAEITIFCDTSNIKKQSIDLNLTNSDFVKAEVFGTKVTPKKYIEAGEREIDLSVDGDLNVLKKYAIKSDIFINLENKRFGEIGFNPEEIIKLNPKLIFANISNFNQTNSKFVFVKENMNEEYLELLHQNSKTLFTLGEISCFTKILLTLFNKQNSGKGQILNLSISDSLLHLNRLTSPLLLSIPNAFDRFYLTKDKKVFSLCLPTINDQQKFLKNLNLTNSKEMSAKIAEFDLSELNMFLKGSLCVCIC